MRAAAARSCKAYQTRLAVGNEPGELPIYDNATFAIIDRGVGVHRTISSYAEIIKIACAVLAFMSTGSMTLRSQTAPFELTCPTLARLPGDLKDTEPTENRQWFELRQCPGSSVIVQGYERHHSRPSFSFDTQDGYPIQLVHILNVLVLESAGGSANHLYVFAFQHGKPTLALKRSTAGGVAVRQNEKAVSLAVPVKTYPGPDGKFPTVPDAVYNFPLEH
jgi:hypothetical protein